MNIGAVTNSLPYTGVTLPFVSYGGNSLCISLIGMGLLLSVSRFAGSSAVVPRPGGQPGDGPRRPDRAERPVAVGMVGLGRRAHA